MSGVLSEEEMQALRGNMQASEKDAPKDVFPAEILATELRLAKLCVRLETALVDFRTALQKGLARERKVPSEVEIERLTLLSSTQVKELVAANVATLLSAGERAAVAVVSRALVTDLTERIFGGTGGEPSDLAPTPLMARVVKRIVDIACVAWNQTGGKVAPVTLTAEQVLLTPTTKTSLKEEAPIVQIGLRLQLEKSTATFALLIPLSAFAVESAEPVPTSPEVYRALMSTIPVEVRVELGRATLPMQALAAMAPGQVFRLDSHTQGAIAVLIGEERIWRARPTVREQHIGVTIDAWDVQENA